MILNSNQIVMLRVALVLLSVGLCMCETPESEKTTPEDTASDTLPDPAADTDTLEDDQAPSILRMVYILRRQPELSLGAFRDHWREVHAPLVAKHKETLGILGYAQLHNAQPSMNQAMQSLRGTMKCFDGVGEFTIDRDKLEAALETAPGRQAMDELIEDERLFVDFSKSSIWLAEEHVIVEDTSFVPPVPATRLTWVGSRLPPLTEEEFQDYYLNNHAPLVAGYAELLGIRDYVQLHTIDDSLGHALRELRGEMLAPFGIHAEFYWNLGSISSAEGLKGLRKIEEDEKKFIDFSHSAIWTAEEHIFWP